MASADILIINGAVLTMDKARPRAQAVAITGNRITKTGTTKSLMSLRGRKTKVIDAKGATVLPGFNEAHCHIFPGSLELSGLDLSGVKTADGLRKALLDFDRKHPGSSIIVGQQATYAMIEGRPLTRDDVDGVLPGRPVLLFASDHHTAWANTMALEQAGILRGKKLPPGNEVVMGADGLANGELREMQAFDPVLALAPEHARSRFGLSTGGEPEPYPSQQDFETDLGIMRQGLAHMARHGITSFQNMDGNLYTCELLAELERRGELTCRAYMPFHFKPFMALAALERASSMQARYKGPMVKAGAVKCFMDGVLDSYTAVLRGGYADALEKNGDPLFSQELFNATAIEADRRGLQIAVHAIGEQAVHMVLNGYEVAARKNGKRDSRHRIEHIETLLDEDIKRFRKLGVLASMQTPHPPGAHDFPLEPTITRIGVKRWANAYGWQTLRKAGATLVFGTDWPVSDVNPLRAVHAGVTRKTWRDDMPDQSMKLLDVLEAYTVGGAIAEFAENEKGKIKRGMLADVTVLDRDIEKIPSDEIQRVKVTSTICDGRVVFGS